MRQNNLLDELGDAGNKLRDAGDKAAESAKAQAEKQHRPLKTVGKKAENITPYTSINPNQIMGAYRGD